MSNYPNQDQPSWSGRSSRDEQFGRYRDPDSGGRQQRQMQQDAGRQEGSYGDSGYNSAYSERDFYEQNSQNSNYGAQRGGRPPHRNEPWPRNEDRENYSAAGDYGRPDYSQTGRDFAPGNRYNQGQRHLGSSRSYGQSFGGQSYGGPGAGYPQMQDPRANRAPYRDQGDSFSQGSPFAQGTYGASQYGTQYDSLQPGYFQAGDFSQRGGYTRSEFPEDTGYLYSHPQSYNNQQAGRSSGTQGWQEREGAQRGAFGLQNSHRGRGPQGYSRSDERIKEDICERLSEHHYIDASQIRVEVNQGVVTLEGSVDDRWQKYQTEDLADATSGVKDIQNRLSVSRASRQSAQWTSQAAAPQTANAQQDSGSGDTNSGKRPLGEKSGDATRGKPGTTN